jgi:RNA polymerase sigma-70 factor (ECF subfamily)
MYRVAHNTASRHVSRAVRNPKATASDTQLRKQAAPNPGPEEAVAQADARARLQDCIGQLRTLDREIILLYLEDLPQTEIAEVTGLSQANISTRIHRIKGQLKEMMSP